MGQFFRERINIAHGLIDEGQYEQAVEVLKNLKMRIHDNTEKTKIEEWERTVEGQYLKSKEEISTQFSDIEQQFEKYFILKKQRAMKYLEYYDIMSNEYDF